MTQITYSQLKILCFNHPYASELISFSFEVCSPRELNVFHTAKAESQLETLEI